MLRAIRRNTFVVALMSASALFGCTIVDHYSLRAVDYNKEAETAQESVLILNIIRASLRRPMQFTSLSSITGTASVSGSLQGNALNTRQVPFLGTFPSFVNPIGTNTDNAISRINTGAATGNVAMSGGATFTVPVLDTQEFYQGILTPVPLQVVDYYLQQGFPPELLFDLFVNKIEVIRLDDGNCEKFTFQNSVRNPLQFGQFQAFIDYMIGSGLSAERINSISAFGPPIPQASNVSASVSETAQILDAYSKVSAAGLDIRQEGTVRTPGTACRKGANVFASALPTPAVCPRTGSGSRIRRCFAASSIASAGPCGRSAQAEGGGECTHAG
jgi:hypothetical protein